MANAIREDAKDTAKKIRQALKQAFPKFPANHFSVKSKTYSGGSSITVDWTDTPSIEEVEKITKKFESATFDSMTDYKDSVGYIWEVDGQCYNGADFVFTRKQYSLERIKVLRAIYTQLYSSDIEFTPHLCEQLSTRLDKGEFDRPTQEAPTEEYKMQYAEQIVNAIRSKWYGVHTVDLFVRELLNDEPNLMRISPKEFLLKHLAAIMTYSATRLWVRNVINRGYSLEHPIHLEYLYQIAVGEFALKRPVSTEDEAIQELQHALIGEFADYFVVTEVTQEDALMWNHVCAKFKQAGWDDFDTLSDVPLEALKSLKRLTEEKQFQLFVSYAQQLCIAAKQQKAKATSPDAKQAVQLSEQEIMRMKRLEKLVMAYRKEGLQIYGTFKEINNIPCLVLSGKGTPYLINVFGIFKVINNRQEKLVGRNPSDSYACFENIIKYLLPICDLNTARALNTIINQAFDLRRKV